MARVTPETRIAVHSSDANAIAILAMTPSCDLWQLRCSVVGMVIASQTLCDATDELAIAATA
jgi:hypothetical protein